MITLTEQYYTPVNIGMVVLLIVLAIVGYRKGFLLQVISFAGTIVSGWGSYILAPMLAKYIPLFPRGLNPMEDTVLGEASYRYVNQIAWFFLVFLLFRVVFLFLGIFAKTLQKVPVIKEFSKVIGAFTGAAEALIWMFILTIALNTPVFVNGHETVARTGLHYVRDGAQYILQEFAPEYTDIDAFGQLFEDAKGLSESQRERIEQWMISHGYLKESE